MEKITQISCLVFGLVCNTLFYLCCLILLQTLNEDLLCNY